jgi:hypothetical protein
MSDVAQPRDARDEHDVARTHRLLAARERLLSVLGGIADAAAEQALVRCPSRTRDDVCTFRGDCRNRITSPPAARRCAGGMLDTRPASAADIAAALDDIANDA